MEEIEKIHQADTFAGWGTVAALMEKCATYTEEIKRLDMQDMLSEAFDDMEKIKDPVERFFNCFQYAFRLYYRLKVMDSSMPLNRITKEVMYKNGRREDVYAISNYSYSIYNWARGKGFIENIDNLTLKIPISKLSQAENKKFEGQIKKESE